MKKDKMTAGQYKAERKKKLKKWAKPRSAAARKQDLRGER